MTVSLCAFLSLSGWRDIRRLEREAELLQASCDWYYGDLTWKQAHDILKNKPVGTFLLRNSSNPNFLFSLSIKTQTRAVSVRIGYYSHSFGFDNETPSKHSHFRADSVVGLVESEINTVHKHVFLSGGESQWVVLTQPAKKHPSRLQHLCRVSINRSLGTTASERVVHAEKLSLPRLLRRYLQQYPHSV